MPTSRRGISVITLALGTLALGACSSNSSDDSTKPDVVASSQTSSGSPSAASSSPGTAPSGSSTSTVSSSTAPSMSADAAKASLATAAKTSVVSAVPVGNGYEGASADTTTMHFWRTDASGAWVKDGDAPRTPSFSSAVPESIDGAKIRGAQHAAFILQADLGGTGSSPTAQAFGRAADGWGAIASTTDDGSAIALKHAADWNGTWHSADFKGDLLMLGQFVPGIANADGHDVTRAWAMKGDRFTLVSTDDPSTKAQHFTASKWSRFTSPSGKNYCEISTGGVTCTLSPAVAATHGGKNFIALTGDGWVLGAGDPGSTDPLDFDSQMWATTGGGATPPQVDGTRVLSYGSSITSGDVTCKSSENGFACNNAVASFTVNTKQLTTTGRQGPQPQAETDS